VGVAGDFERDDMLKLITSAFGGWAAGSSDLPPVLPLAAAPGPGVYHFQKRVPQSTIRMGHLSVGRGHPDEFALRVMNFILGGQGFRSRLGERVRSDEGLAYSVGSRYELDAPLAGVFEARCETKAASTFRTMTIMSEEIGKMQSAPPTERELHEAREALVNSFIHRWVNPVSTLEQMMDLELSGRPADYYQTYLDRLRAVTVEDVQRVARDYLHPDRLTTVIVGDAPAMGTPPAGVTLVPVELPREYMGEQEQTQAAAPKP
jgi:zinc protease